VTQFVGVMTIVLVRNSLREAVSQVQTSERGIGLLGFGVSGSNQ
jgi:phosphatidylinositol-bisphosphatase